MSDSPTQPRRTPRFRTDRRGVAATEFALLLPVLIASYFGVMEVVRIVDTNRKVTQFTRTIADLSGRATNGRPSASDIEAILGAAGAIMRPYPTTRMTVALHAMGVEPLYGRLYGGVCSSYPQDARPVLTLNGTNGLPETPATQNYDGARYILAEVSLPYTPIVGSQIFRMIFGTSSFAFTRQISWSERLDKGEVVMPQGTPCPNL